MEKETARFDWTLEVECPLCKKDIDLIAYDDDGEIAHCIFNNRWDDLKDYSIYCECGEEFKLDGVEY